MVFALTAVLTAYAASVTVLEVIQLSTDFLAKKGVESPRLQAELLLSHLLAMPRMQLYLNFQRPLTSSEQDVFREMVRRRGTREPLQHVIGSVSFCGLELEVTRDVLIPRPETELLAENGWIFLNGLAQPVGSSRRTETVEARSALDFGTGSGCLAITLAARSAGASITALDISSSALAVAQRNALRHGLSHRIEFVLGNGFPALRPDMRFDLILANPPYIPTAEIEQLEPEVRDYDPRNALDGGPDGLAFHRQLAIAAGAFLKPQGKLMLEFADGQETSVAKLFEDQNWIVERVVNDYTQRPRILIALARV